MTIWSGLPTCFLYKKKNQPIEFFETLGEFCKFGNSATLQGYDHIVMFTHLLALQEKISPVNFWQVQQILNSFNYRRIGPYGHVYLLACSTRKNISPVIFLIGYFKYSMPPTALPPPLFIQVVLVPTLCSRAFSSWAYMSVARSPPSVARNFRGPVWSQKFQYIIKHET